MNRNIREQVGTGDQGTEVRVAEGAGGQQTRQQTRHLPDDFGDLEQYVELSHIGSGEHHISQVIIIPLRDSPCLSGGCLSFGSFLCLY